MSCKYLHIVNSATVVEGSGDLLLDFSVPVTSLNDKERFCFKIPCGVTIPSGIDGNKVAIQYGESSYYIYNKYGNNVTVGELKKNKVIKGYFGTGGGGEHFITSDLPVTFNCGCNNVL